MTTTARVWMGPGALRGLLCRELRAFAAAAAEEPDAAHLELLERWCATMRAALAVGFRWADLPDEHRRAVERAILDDGGP